MLKLKKVEGISLNVAVRLPTDDPKVFNEGSFTVRLKNIKRGDLEGILERIRSDELDDAGLLREHIIEVTGLGDENGDPITGAAALEELLTGSASAYLVPAVVGEFFEHFKDARAKNSKPSRGR